MSSSPLQPAWFTGAPVSKLLTATLVLGHIWGRSSAGSSFEDDFTRYNTTGGGQRWHRLLTSKFAFGSSGEMALGMIVLSMQLKRIERQIGSRKLVALLLFSNALAIAFEFLTALVWGDSTLLAVVGPFPWIGTILYLYAALEPRVYPRFASALGFSFSEKSLQYALCAYLLLGSTSTAAALPHAFLGGLAGYLFVKVRMIDLPDWLVERIPWERYFSFFIDAPAQIHAPLLQVAPGQRRRGPAAAAAAAPPAQPPQPAMPPPPPPPPEASVEQLTSMGFERQRVLDALRQSDNNVEHAANRLLMGT